MLLDWRHTVVIHFLQLCATASNSSISILNSLVGQNPHGLIHPGMSLTDTLGGLLPYTPMSLSICRSEGKINLHEASSG